MNKTLINLLLRLKNISLVRKEVVYTKYFLVYKSLISLLYKEGYIQSFKIVKKNNQKFIYLIIRSVFNEFIFSNLNILLKKGKKLNLNKNEISTLNSKNLLLVFSTNLGLKSHIACKKSRIGGKMLFIC